MNTLNLCAILYIGYIFFKRFWIYIYKVYIYTYTLNIYIYTFLNIYIHIYIFFRLEKQQRIVVREACLGANWGPPWNPSDHHSTIVLRGLRRSVNVPPLCREAPVWRHIEWCVIALKKIRLFLNRPQFWFGQNENENFQ